MMLVHPEAGDVEKGLLSLIHYSLFSSDKLSINSCFE